MEDWIGIKNLTTNLALRNNSHVYHENYQNLGINFTIFLAFYVRFSQEAGNSQDCCILYISDKEGHTWKRRVVIFCVISSDLVKSLPEQSHLK
jgi:hypothetical protein